METAGSVFGRQEVGRRFGGGQAAEGGGTLHGAQRPETRRAPPAGFVGDLEEQAGVAAPGPGRLQGRVREAPEEGIYSRRRGGVQVAAGGTQPCRPAGRQSTSTSILRHGECDLQIGRVLTAVEAGSGPGLGLGPCLGD